MPRKASPIISDRAKAIYNKLQLDAQGDTLTRSERTLEVTREEAAYLLSLRAGRAITPDYLRQLTRGDKPRLRPYRSTGNTYTYLVEALLEVKFTKVRQESSDEKNAA